MPATFWQPVRLLVFSVRGHGLLLQVLSVGSEVPAWESGILYSFRKSQMSKACIAPSFFQYQTVLLHIRNK